MLAIATIFQITFLKSQFCFANFWSHLIKLFLSSVLHPVADKELLLGVEGLDLPLSCCLFVHSYQYPAVSLQKTLKITYQNLRIVCELDYLTLNKMIHRSVSLGTILRCGKGVEKQGHPGWLFIFSLSGCWVAVYGCCPFWLVPKYSDYLFYPGICTLYFRDHCCWLPFTSSCEKQLTKSLLLSVLEKVVWLECVIFLVWQDHD